MYIKDFLAMKAGPDTEPDELVDLRSLDFISSYDPHIECPICHCPFVQPVQLQCDHIFCESCLRSAINTIRSTDSDEFPCPSCRTPITQISMNVPRLLINMCDDIRVRCINGCEELVPRGHIQSHVDKYCLYRLVPCADDNCEQKSRYIDVSEKGACIHYSEECHRCDTIIGERDIQIHDETCEKKEGTCVCGSRIPLSDIKAHAEVCPEVVVPCAASICGCTVTDRRAMIEEHAKICPLANMITFFEAQNNRISSLELNMRQLQERNEILQDGMSNIQSKLCEASRITSQHNEKSSIGESENNDPQSADYNSEELSSSNLPPNPTTYLLSLHESLREDVNQIGHALKDLDTRASMSIMNECMRLHEDMAHTNAALTSVRMQVQWLMSPRIPHPVNTASSQGNDRAQPPRWASVPTPVNTAGAQGNEGAQSSRWTIGAGPSQGPLRPRRTSDTGREGTKL